MLRPEGADGRPQPVSVDSIGRRAMAISGGPSGDTPRSTTVLGMEVRVERIDLIGEKLIMFANPARNDPKFAKELPNFWQRSGGYSTGMKSPGTSRAESQPRGGVFDSFSTCAERGPDTMALNRAEFSADLFHNSDGHVTGRQ
ncbi:MAG: hypothetical protein HY701_11780 [Gemmatimonadetes bacterium]|nr:hypothetical protein [Gemmatimonadota bacterium]